MILAMQASRRTAAAEIGWSSMVATPAAPTLLGEGGVVDGDHDGGGVAAVQGEPGGVDVLEERGEPGGELHLVGAPVVGVLALLAPVVGTVAW